MLLILNRFIKTESKFYEALLIPQEANCFPPFRIQNTSSIMTGHFHFFIVSTFLWCLLWLIFHWLFKNLGILYCWSTVVKVKTIKALEIDCDCPSMQKQSARTPRLWLRAKCKVFIFSKSKGDTPGGIWTTRLKDNSPRTIIPRIY